MKHWKKKGAALLLACLLALTACLLPQAPSVQVEAAVVEGNFEWIYDESLGGVEIRNYRGTNSTISIPSYLGGNPVVSIGTSAFASNTFLRSVTIPDTVTQIKDYAFSNCVQLETIHFSQNLASIGSSAFSGSDQLMSVSFPASLRSIGSSAFANCENLIVATFQEGLESMAGYVFQGASLTVVTLPDSLRSMSDKTFYGSGVVQIRASTNSLGHQYATRNNIAFVSTGTMTPDSGSSGTSSTPSGGDASSGGGASSGGTSSGKESAVKLAIPSLTLQVGATYDCIVTEPLTGDLTITVSNDCVGLVDGGKLTVEVNGRSFRLYGQKAGSCTVTVKASEGSVTLPVTVEPSSQPVTPPASSGWTSDTTTDLTIEPGKSYQFKFTAAKPDEIKVWLGTPDVFTVQKTATESNAVYYKLTATGKPGAQAGVYVSYEGGSGTKLCVATVAGGTSSGGSSSGSGSGTTPPAAATLTCDTTSNFGLAKGGSYQFRLTTSDGKKPSFWAGTSGVFDVQYMGQSGSDFFYKITAVGEPGSEAGFYAACEGQSGVKQCVVTIAFG